MAKYDALRDHLEALPVGQSTNLMRFSEIDRIVGGLPPSARRIPQWWANDSKVQGRAWRAAGWHVDGRGLDLNAETVRFARGSVGGTRARGLSLVQVQDRCSVVVPQPRIGVTCRTYP